MKQVLLFIALLGFSVSMAQEEIRVVVKTKTFTFGDAPAFTVEIPQAKFEDVEKAWEKLLKSGTKAKAEKSNGEIFILGKVYEPISSDSMEIFGYVKEYDEVAVLSACFMLNSNFISSESDEEIYYPTKKYIKDFAIEQYQNAVQDELDEENKELKKLKTELNRLVGSEEAYIKEINTWERDVLKKRDEITLNEMDQSDKVIQMQAQKELILTLANALGDEQETAEKTLKQMEKDFKKLQKEHSNLHNQIDNLEASVRANQKKIEEVVKNQKFVKLDVEDQEYKVRKVEKKLAGIE